MWPAAEVAAWGGGGVRACKREGGGRLSVYVEIVGRRWKARAERTENMAIMLVTLEVSKCSG